MPRKRIPLIERFFKFVGQKSYDECWNWTGVINPAGYGMLSIGVRADNDEPAHRVSWVLFNGKLIPDGLVIDHLCRNRKCCNPTHLRVCTFRENVMCGISPSALNAKKTHCKRGHSLEDALLQKLKNGSIGRSCRTCMRTVHHDRKKARYHAKRIVVNNL